MLALAMITGLFVPAVNGQAPGVQPAIAATAQCPAGVEPEQDFDGDCVDDNLERQGFDQNLDPCIPGSDNPGCFVTDPTAWSSDGDPYSDFQEATGVNMDNTVVAPYNGPLVAAMPRIEIMLLRYRFTPKATITDSEGREVSQSSTQEFSVETTVGISVTTGVEVEAGLTGGVTASTEVEKSFSVTAGYSSSQTQGESLNWETATTTEADNAASLALDIAARNVGSATALDVTPTFNLFLGDEPLGTIKPDQPFPANLIAGETSDFITVDRRQKGNTNEEITLSIDQLRRIQRGAPIKIQVIGLEAGISRWRPEDSNWSCPDPCQWEEFQNQIEARTLRLLVDFGYSGEREEAIPREYAGNPFEYRVYTGSPNVNPGFSLRDLLSFIGYEMQPQGNQTMIRGRPYPSQWYLSSGPETGGATRDSTFQDYWDAAGEPADVLEMQMPTGASLLMASPDPEDAGPLMGGDRLYQSMRGLYVSAVEKGSIPIEGGEAHLFFTDGRKKVVPLERIGESSYYATPDSSLYPIAPGNSFIVMRDILGNERTLGPGIASSYPIASSCAGIDPGYFREPSWSEINGTVTVFIDGDLTKPATAFCFNTSGGTDFWYPQATGISENDMFGIAVLDLERRVAVGQGVIAYSEDAGQSWSRMPLGEDTFTTYRAVTFREGTETGVAVGDGGIFMRTEDGGRTWAPTAVSGATGEYHDVDYAGGDTWYAVGQNRVRRSTDNGLTWAPASVIEVDDDGNQVERPDFVNLTAVSFISETVGVIGDHLMSDNKGRVWLTENGGETWKVHSVFTRLNDIAYDGKDAWYIVGRNVILRNGITSTDRDSIVFSGSESLVLEAVSFPTPEIGYVVNTGGQVFQTGDGGETWASPFGGYPTPSHPGANFMRDIHMLDANIGGVVGTAGVVGATDSGGGVPHVIVATNVEYEPAIELPRQIELDQNYPNPFNPVTTITYSLAESQEIRLDVFDLLGRRVATLVDGFKPSGQHLVRFNATDLSSGVYLYRLQAEADSEVRRMVLLR